MSLPFLEVSHLASSSSFHSAVAQAIGLRYIGNDPSPAATSQQPGGPSVTFGVPQLPVFQLRQTTDRPLKLSHVVFTAPSAQAVRDFHAFALRANPLGGEWAELPPPVLPLLAPTPESPAKACQGGDSPTSVRVADFDGNIMDVVYVPPQNAPVGYDGSTTRTTQSSRDEITRIMSWNYDVASAPARASRHYASSHYADSAAAPDQPYLLRRSVTTSTIMEHPYPAGSPREDPKAAAGMSSGMVGLLGAAVGAAAGAAVTYGMMSRDRSQAPIQEFGAPSIQRRSTFPDPYPDQRHGPFVELERTVEKVRYPGQYPRLEGAHAPAPTYVARYSQAGAVPQQLPAPDDVRSRVSTRYQVGPPPPASVRNPTDVSTARAGPRLLTETEHRSYVGSRHCGGGEATARSYAPSRHAGGEADRRSYVDVRSMYPAAIPIPASVANGSSYEVATSPASYVSARSQRSSASTIKPKPEAVSYKVVSSAKPSRAPSRATATMRDPVAQAPRSFSRADSQISARHVPLPRSRNGWGGDDDDDNDSIAPSDSISCVGSSSSRRRHRSYR